MMKLQQKGHKKKRKKKINYIITKKKVYFQNYLKDKKIPSNYARNFLLYKQINI